MYYDLHTHHFPEGNGDICTIVNVSTKDLQENLLLPPPEGDRLTHDNFALKSGVSYPPLEGAGGGNNSNIFYSIGIHPWHIQKDNIEKKLDLIEKYALFPHVKAIGECGLDKCCKTDFELQKEVFSSHISISEKAGKPLIIHCVKSFDELISFKKESRPAQTWIIHGFRGKPQQAKQLIKQGFYLSFGMNYNEQSLQNIPIERMFFETDDSGCDIRIIYENAAKTLNTPEKNLIRQIEQNVNSVFTPKSPKGDFGF